MIRHGDDVNAVFGFEARVGIGQHEEFAAPGFDFLQVALELFQQLVVRGDGDHWHVFVDQCQWAVLELTGSIGFGVDVGDLFELEVRHLWQVHEHASANQNFRR